MLDTERIISTQETKWILLAENIYWTGGGLLSGFRLNTWLELGCGVETRGRKGDTSRLKGPLSVIEGSGQVTEWEVFGDWWVWRLVLWVLKVGRKIHF